MPKPTELLSFWFAALAEPLGIYITSPDPILAKSRFYTARNNHRTSTGDTSLDHLQIRTAPDDVAHGLWIVRGPKPEDEA